MSQMQVKQQHHFVSLCRKMTVKGAGAALAEPQLRAGKSQGTISSRKEDGEVETAQQDGDVSPGPAGMKLSALQELHL